jgi:hypothetical protein
VLYLFATFGAMDELYNDIGWMLHKEGDRYPQIIAIGSLWSSDFRAFRHHRRFTALVERLRLIDYWRQVGPPDGCRLVPAGVDCSR